MRKIRFRSYAYGRFFYFRAGQGNSVFMLKSFSDDLYLNAIIFEQFTGLQDKNGKDIYEGDIVKGVQGYFVQPVMGVVSYGGMAFNFHNKNLPEEWFYTVTNPDIKKLPEIEVIGNIHENPELASEITD